jgi:hypothetical protein
LFNV